MTLQNVSMSYKAYIINECLLATICYKPRHAYDIHLRELSPPWKYQDQNSGDTASQCMPVDWWQGPLRIINFQDHRKFSSITKHKYNRGKIIIFYENLPVNSMEVIPVEHTLTWNTQFLNVSNRMWWWKINYEGNTAFPLNLPESIFQYPFSLFSLMELLRKHCESSYMFFLHQWMSSDNTVQGA